MTERPHPFESVFGAIAGERFSSIRDVCGATPPLDAFMLARPAIELLQHLRPDEGIGEAIDDFVAFTYAAFRFWAAGSRTARLDEPATRALCDPAIEGLEARSTAPQAMYIQLAPRIIWAQLSAGTSFEPLDGWFHVPEPEGGVRIVACLGVHPARPGLSVIALEGGHPGVIARDDRSPLFSPTMPGGEAAGLHAIAGAEEMILLAWRARQFTEVG